MMDVSLASDHALDDRGFVVARTGPRVKRSGCNNYAKVVCRSCKIQEFFFFDDRDARSRARSLDAAMQRKGAVEAFGPTSLSTWNPCAGMPDHVRAVNVQTDNEETE